MLAGRDFVVKKPMYLVWLMHRMVSSTFYVISGEWFDCDKCASDNPMSNLLLQRGSPRRGRKLCCWRV